MPQFYNDISLHLPTDFLESCRLKVQGYFQPEALTALLTPGVSATERLALAWLGGEGKRYRPYLATTTYLCLKGQTDQADEQRLAAMAVAVEAFHKASLLHDDIADEDDFRYGRATFCREYGVGTALNVGDLLLGWGYGLIGRIDLPESARLRLLRIAAKAHQRLCIGQGEELHSRGLGQMLTTEQVLQIFGDKTAPAFSAALESAAAAAQADETLMDYLGPVAQTLGVAYQIRDDLHDILEPQYNELHTLRPLLVLAVVYERADAALRRALTDFYRRSPQGKTMPQALRQALTAAQTQAQMCSFLDDYRGRLQRLIGRIPHRSFRAAIDRAVQEMLSL